MNQDYDPKNNNSTTATTGPEAADELSLASADFGPSTQFGNNEIVVVGATENVEEPRITLSAAGLTRVNDNAPVSDEIFSSAASLAIASGPAPAADPEPQAETISLASLPHSAGHREIVWSDGVKQEVETSLRAVTSGPSAPGTERVSFAA